MMIPSFHLFVFTIESHTSRLRRTSEKQKDNLKHCIDIDTTNGFMTGQQVRLQSFVSNPLLLTQLKEGLTELSLERSLRQFLVRDDYVVLTYN